MKTVVCPLCLKHTPIGSFHPDLYPVEIRVLEKRGLGRGKGFETISDDSIFDFYDDPEIQNVLRQIAYRAIATLKLMIDEGRVIPEGVAGALGLNNSDTEDVE